MNRDSGRTRSGRWVTDDYSKVGWTYATQTKFVIQPTARAACDFTLS